ncbi:MAG: bifunctional DNA-formamidopyrimidine glycosylase/DNA-(apurinic or apyrimidinic site) lyase [Steroidobacteraceae bacterium]
MLRDGAHFQAASWQNTQMPELPEVETTRRGILPVLKNQRITLVTVRDARLRWPVAPEFAKRLTGQRIVDVQRRAKYLLIQLERGTVIWHLGMSGSLRVLATGTQPQLHDHIDVQLDSGRLLRFNDPRRFGCALWTGDDPAEHELIAHLGPEPLSDDFHVEYLAAKAKGRSVAIKQFIMNAEVVVGVGNIYASEALFRAGIKPRRSAGRIKREEWQRLVAAIKQVLSDAIKVGGTTLRDYVNANGTPGYFRQKLFVYERAGEPCRKCKTDVLQIVQGNRSTYYCPTCQK